ncbi:amidohydrolase [Natranaerobius thermophilus]|uniref:Peptidase M20 domain-containing protein 2 n=1 Tax=Natranaerobius thermophilus (strain ATCC BAA-1301 / DSM 18059 / JW/NM-WN-LF) TaxID=457570 RepID=B2A6T3_NATTJ|nr:amidohydrolase [Natranaerobius thermophilus]ACB84214.1 amidohydrolase [Natranaerobius thermophilus JW/NM-WN-LF]
MESQKKLINKEIDSIKDILENLNYKIYYNPELAFQEYQGVEFQKEILEKFGFKFLNPVGGLETAFIASYQKDRIDKKVNPTISFLSEYDALPDIGHACGHNLIATAAVGAAIGLSRVLDKSDKINGTINVIGTPAEEGGGGKIHLIDAGAFHDTDFAMMVHPAPKNMIGRGGLACTKVTVESFGEKNHSAAPHKGINALTALINVFNEIEIIKGSTKSTNKINGIITHGGSASNVIPDYARGVFTVRSATGEELENLLDKINNITKGAELLTNAKLKCQHDLIYQERYPNKSMGEAFKANLESMEEQVTYPARDEILGSSDIGNVSKCLPIIHPYIKIANEAIRGHTDEFSRKAGEDMAFEQTIKSAKAMAMTGYDLLTSVDLREQIIQEFNSTVY